MKYTETYVEYTDRRRMFPERTTKQVSGRRDPERAREQCPQECDSFEFYAVEFEKATTEAGELVEVNHKRVNVGRLYVLPPATVFSQNDIENQNAAGQSGHYDILLENMRGNGLSHVVRTRTGKMIPYDSENTILLK